MLEAIARAWQAAAEQYKPDADHSSDGGFRYPVNHEPDRRPRRSPIGDKRACPDCGRPQHYTGHEYGWAHDALIDTWHCNSPSKASVR